MLVTPAETNVLAIPHHEFTPHLEQVIDGKLAAFVLHSTTDFNDGFPYTVRQTLADANFAVSTPVSINRQFLNNPAWHSDMPPNLQDPEVASINFHLTTAGQALCRFIAHQPKNTGRWNEKDRHALERGLVDNKRFEPTCSQVIAEPGTLIVFRAAGRQPLAHSFESTVIPRESSVWVARNFSTLPSNL